MCGACGAADLPAGFVRLSDVAPGVAQDIRYAGSDNFTGRPVDGYGAGACWLREDAARALARAEAAAQATGFRLIVWDCYRPQRATEAFLRWARDASDQAMKARYYPAIDKSRLFAEQYIGKNSTHSAGVSVDLGMQRADGAPLDFGTIFDFFDPRSATASPHVPATARANRARLKRLMEAQGFANYSREWWHYGLRGAAGAVMHDVPISR